MASEPTSSIVAAARPPLLGVARSVLGRAWIEREGDTRLGLAISQRLGLPEIVGRALAARGVADEGAERFLAPRIKDHLPDPHVLKDMAVAVERLAAAIVDGESIAAFADYDVDGATSAAVLMRVVRAAGGRIRHYVPDRLREGYGPSAAALAGLADQGVSLVVTLDCGTTAHEALADARPRGLDVIVVDHHEAEARLPEAFAIVNPNRLDEGGALRTLAACGVTFLLAVGLNRALRGAGWFKTRPEPDLMGLLDLVALGTVCDVVPLSGLNRAFVAQGLQVMRARANVGLAALADVARLSEPPGAYHLGFVLGPRVNAGGRVGEADLGARLLSTDDPAEAAQLAAKLDAHNRERRLIEQGVLDGALAAAKETTGPLVFVAGEGWHPGVIGIVASRLVAQTGRPACVAALADGRAVGSGRSVAGIDLGSAVIAARQAGLLLKGGGHAMAAGFTAEAARLDDLKAFLAERIARQVPPEGLVSSFKLDGVLRLGGATLGLVENLSALAPFGSGNPEPRFAFASVRVVHAAPMGTDHVRVTLADEGGGRLRGVAFGVMQGPLGPALARSGGAPMHVAGCLRLDTWQGRNAPELLIDDAAPLF